MARQRQAGDYNTVDMSLVKMYNHYLPPYHAAVAAGAGSVMHFLQRDQRHPRNGQ